jgi:dCTP deaminase
MILTGTQIREYQILDPHVERTTVPIGPNRSASYGESFAGYDIRLDQSVHLEPGYTFLASSLEQFQMPDNVLGVVHDKSTWARLGLAVQNTVIEPGWGGFLTLELVWTPLYGDLHRASLHLEEGWPIAQVVFHLVNGRAQYVGKYQNQKRGPQEAL